MARDSNNEVSKPIRWQEMSDCFSRSGKHLFAGALSDALVLLMLAQRAVDVLDPLKQLASHRRGVRVGES